MSFAPAVRAATGPAGFLSRTTTLRELARGLPVGISVLSARVAHSRARLTMRPDQTVEEIAALCGIPPGRLLAELAGAAERDARGECVWSCGRR